MKAASTDFLIVGGGLAGSLLAHRLIGRGKRVTVIDNGLRHSASKVAAGIINPLTGRRMAPTWKGETLLPFAAAFYRSLESEFGCQLFHPIRIRRYWQNDEEEMHLRRRRLTPFFEGCLGEPLFEGGVIIRNGAYVDTVTLLNAMRRFICANATFIETTFDYKDVQVDRQGVEWRGLRAGCIVFCEGDRARRNPFWDWIPFQPAKGQVLTVRIPGLGESDLVIRGKWFLPVGEDVYRVGSTYEWDCLDETPTDAGRNALLEFVKWVCPNFRGVKVTGRLAGVRPIVRDNRPVIGRHPVHERVAVFNGLGSKGVLLAPYFAGQLAAFLEEGTPVDGEANVRRNF